MASKWRARVWYAGGMRSGRRKKTWDMPLTWDREMRRRGFSGLADWHAAYDHYSEHGRLPPDTVVSWRARREVRRWRTRAAWEALFCDA